METIDKNNLPDLTQAVVSEKDLFELKQEQILEKYAKRFQIYQNDFSAYKFRPHAIFNLMGGLPKPLTERQIETLAAYQEKLDFGKKLTEKQYEDYGSLLAKKNAKPTLSNGAKNYLKELFKEITFQRTNEIKSMYLDKGLAVEHLSIELFAEVFGVDLYKNQIRYENEYFTGEPDIITFDEVIDIKSSWDFTTFPMMDEEVENQNYFYQLHGYMDILGYDKAKLIYVLVDTPEEIINDHKRKVSWQLGLINEEVKYDLPEDLDFEITRNLTYQDIPQEARIKIFEVPRDEAVINLMHHQVELARKFLQELNNSLEKRFINHIN